MRKIVVEKNNKKVVNYIKSKFNNVPESAIYKALRQKDIRVNDKKISENISLELGDEITIYIKDEILYGSSLTLKKQAIIYDDENIVILNKPQGILVQGTKNDIGLDQLINRYFHTDSIVPCHRLDRNTSGIIIFAKNAESEEIILKLIKNHEISKHYSCLVYGHPKQKTATLKAYLFKDRKNNRVIISEEKKKGYVEIVTKYTVINTYSDNTSLLNVELITGKTHQIRAHLAYIGYPIIGDGKYGINEVNKKFGKTWQELESYKICFNNAYGKLEYLKGKTFTLGIH
ncbi:MAG: RluA family pseudouridine synthase [Clostridia bacterium]|nr:RluA family pseudouridine synthase [Clostridia bacterium]